MSIAGRRSTNAISTAALIAQAASFLGNSSPLPLFWGIFVILFQRSFDIPPEDDVTPIVSDVEEANKGPTYYLRAIALAVCAVMTAVMILPVPIDLSTLQAGIRPNSFVCLVKSYFFKKYSGGGGAGGIFGSTDVIGGSTGLIQVFLISHIVFF